jgi:predicted AAA+ superfamily ATPase
MYIKRKIEQKLMDLAASFPVVLVTGARQVGKTTLLERLCGPDRKYVSLDVPDVRIMAKDEPVAFMAKYKPPLIIDEFQYAPNLLPYIKAYVDKHKNNGDFWLAGSQSFVSMKNVSESLAGRVGILNLFSLSRSEITGTLFSEYETDFNKLIQKQNHIIPVDKSASFSNILKGGMPQIYHGLPATIQDYFGSYFQTYLSRDIKDLAQVADELSFYKFMRICGSLATSQVDYTEISNRSDISVKKANEWISVLVSSGIIILLPPYFNNSLKRVLKTPRLYFMDTGLLCYLRGIDNAELLEKSVDCGVFFENYVVSEVYKSYVNVGKRSPLYYYRDANNRKEIDLLIEQNNTVYPIEIKVSTNPDKKAVKNFDAITPIIHSGLTIGAGNVLCNCSDIYPLGNDRWAVPHWYV